MRVKDWKVDGSERSEWEGGEIKRSCSVLEGRDATEKRR